MKTVLIVEDDPSIISILTMLLESEGYAVRTAVNGAAVPLAQAERPDVILLDINMPGMNGLEVARHLRADERTQAIPIALMSATDNLRQRASNAPVNLLIPKPFDLNELLASVAQLTEGATGHP